MAQLSWQQALAGFDRGRPLLACRELASSAAGEVWRLTTSAGDFALKRRRTVDRAIEFGRMRVLQNFAAQHGLAPRLLWDDAASGDELAEFVAGTAVSPEQFSSAGCLSQVAARLGHLHRLPLPPAWVGISGWQFDIQEHVCKRWQRLEASIELTHRAIWRERLEAMPQLLASARLGRRPRALLHLDVHAANLLATPQLVLLDWEYASLGDPLWDLASLLAPLTVEADLAATILDAAGRSADTTWAQLAAARELFRWLNELWTLEQPMATMLR